MASSQSSDEDEAWSPWNTLDETVVEVSRIAEEEGSFNSEYYTSDESFKTPCQSFEFEEITVAKSTDATEIITNNSLSESTAKGNCEESEGHHDHDEETHDDVMVVPTESNQVTSREDNHDESKIIREEIQEEYGTIPEGVQEDRTITTDVSFTSPHQLSPFFEDKDTFGVLVNFQTPPSVFSSIQCGPRRRPSSCCKSARWCINHYFVSTPTQIAPIPFELPSTPVNNEEQEPDTSTSPNDEDKINSGASCINLSEAFGEDDTLDEKTANKAMIESHVSIPNSLEMLQTITSGMPTVNDRNQKDDFPKELNELSAYQKYGLRWLVWREQHFPEGGIFVGDVGFDAQAIFKGLIMKSRDRYLHQPTLIVCPNIDVLHKWKKNFSKKRSGLQCYLYHGSRRTMNADKLKQYDVVLTTYHIIVAENPKKASKLLHSSSLMKVYWHRIILDDAEEISKLNLVRTQAILKLEGKHRWAVLWESPPRKNVSPKDLQSIVKFLQLKPFDDEEIWEYLFEGVKESKDGKEERNEIVAEIILNSLIPPARH